MTSHDPRTLADAREALAAAEARAGVTVTEIHNPAESAELVELLNAVWDTDVDIIDHAFLTALTHAGCYVAAARRDGQMVGAGVAFFGGEPGVLHSHVLGARPGEAGKGVGQAVKAHSRLWCLERGIARMTWTFDPMQARNAYLNLHVFGAELTDYVDDFYGELNDGLNLGVPTDRAVLAWDVAAPRPPLKEFPVSAHVALPGGKRPGVFAPPPPDARYALVHLPQDIDAIRARDRDAALAWAHAFRTTFHHLLDAGWTPRDVSREGVYAWERIA